LLDGDKIATLMSLVLVNEIRNANLSGEDFSMAVVQTAYANGASTHFMRSKGINTCIAKTGVKYLHHKAGIYFPQYQYMHCIK
jgi:phosphoacetylglucosamine mutase